ncbi:MAG: Chemotaxis response regulator protein-glutamate methylesterase [Pseudomonadota bacterium]|jgi:two-component system chemotaxis response regulator CheB
MAKTVLVVDDSFVMRTLIKSILATEPALEVVGEATNGREALDAIRRQNPDIVLLDIEMAGMDGLECLKRLRLISSARVIIISSVAQAGSPQALLARKLGVDDVIAKPRGAMSLDLDTRKGHAILQAVRKSAEIA